VPDVRLAAVLVDETSMIWIIRVALILAGLLLGAVILNIYLVFSSFVTVYLLGIEHATFRSVQYWVCLAAGYVTSFCLMRSIWPPAPPPD
jgi:hypothetical protein